MAPGRCAEALREARVIFMPVPLPNDLHPCGMGDPVRLVTMGVAALRPAPILECDLADRLQSWHRAVVVPAARRYFGTSIRAVLQMGGYVCRQEIGSRRDYTSQHAFGRAIDIAGWVLADGTAVTFAKDWDGDTAAGAFLRDVAARSCPMFSIVLTPATNGAHRNHMHLDIGPYRFCGAGSG